MRYLIAHLSLLLVVGACAGRRTADSPAAQLNPPSQVRTNVIEPAARAPFQQAETFFTRGRYDQALRNYQAIHSKFPGTTADMYASYRIASIAYYQKRYDAAGQEFNSFLRNFPQSELRFDAIYNLAASEFQHGDLDSAERALGQLHANEIQIQGPRRAELVYLLTSRIASERGNHAGVIASNAALIQLPIPELRRQELLHSNEKRSEALNNQIDLNRLLGEINEPMTRDILQARLAALTAKEIPLRQEASPSTIRISQGIRTKVGIILPLSGKASSLGARALDAILLGVQKAQETLGISLELAIYDTQGSPILSRQGAEKLIRQDSVIAIIGPLHSREAQAVAEVATDARVTNLSLNSKEGLSALGSTIFQNALTARVQLEALVEYAVETRGFHRFAILAPNDAFGRDTAETFWNLLSQRGGRVVAHETYPSDEKDFQSYIQNMVGLSNPALRPLEWQKLGEFLTQQKAKGVRDPKARMPPIVDFDAIFICERPRVVGQIAASLAFFDVDGPTLLGTSDWNQDQLYKRGGKYVLGSIFPGLTLSSHADSSFKDLYTKTYGTQPDMLSAQAFEATWLVASAITRSGSDNRELLTQQLHAARNIETPLKFQGFSELRIAQRPVTILTLAANGQIIEAQ